MDEGIDIALHPGLRAAKPMVEHEAVEGHEDDMGECRGVGPGAGVLAGRALDEPRDLGFAPFEQSAPLRGMPFGRMTSKAEIRSVATIRSCSPTR